jgi:osmotically-inducible protein OsmY
VALAESVRLALAADPALAPFELDALAVSRGTVELTGWVPDRPARARAFRVANQIPGLDGLINSILVHGEDDLSPPPGLSLAGRSA